MFRILYRVSDLRLQRSVVLWISRL